MKGFGTVVTGTLWAGRAARPATTSWRCRRAGAARRGKVRGVQVHGGSRRRSARRQSHRGQPDGDRASSSGAGRCWCGRASSRRARSSTCELALPADVQARAQAARACCSTRARRRRWRRVVLLDAPALEPGARGLAQLHARRADGAAARRSLHPARLRAAAATAPPRRRRRACARWRPSAAAGDGRGAGAGAADGRRRRHVEARVALEMEAAGPRHRRARRCARVSARGSKRSIARSRRCWPVARNHRYTASAARSSPATALGPDAGRPLDAVEPFTPRSRWRRACRARSCARCARRSALDLRVFAVAGVELARRARSRSTASATPAPRRAFQPRAARGRARGAGGARALALHRRRAGAALAPRAGGARRRAGERARRRARDAGARRHVVRVKPDLCSTARRRRAGGAAARAPHRATRDHAAAVEGARRRVRASSPSRSPSTSTPRS